MLFRSSNYASVQILLRALHFIQHTLLYFYFQVEIVGKRARQMCGSQLNGWRKVRQCSHGLLIEICGHNLVKYSSKNRNAALLNFSQPVPMLMLLHCMSSRPVEEPLWQRGYSMIPSPLLSSQVPAAMTCCTFEALLRASIYIINSEYVLGITLTSFSMRKV